MVRYFNPVCERKKNVLTNLWRLRLTHCDVRGQYVGGGPHCPLLFLLAARWVPLLKIADRLGPCLSAALRLRLLLLAARPVVF